MCFGCCLVHLCLMLVSVCTFNSQIKLNVRSKDTCEEYISHQIKPSSVKKKKSAEHIHRPSGCANVHCVSAALPVFRSVISSLINFLKLGAKIIANCGGVHRRHATWKEVVRRLHGVLLQFVAVGLSWRLCPFQRVYFAALFILPTFSDPKYIFSVECA